MASVKLNIVQCFCSTSELHREFQDTAILPIILTTNLEIRRISLFIRYTNLVGIAHLFRFFSTHPSWVGQSPVQEKTQ